MERELFRRASEAYERGALLDARNLYDKAWAAGSVPAAVNLANMLRHGQGGPVDHARAKDLYEAAVERDGDSDALVCLALMYRRGEGVEVDTARAKELDQRAADMGNPVALNNVACALWEAQQHRDRAADYFERAARLGSADAARNLKAVRAVLARERRNEPKQDASLCRSPVRIKETPAPRLPDNVENARPRSDDYQKVVHKLDIIEQKKRQDWKDQVEIARKRCLQLGLV